MRFGMTSLVSIVSLALLGAGCQSQLAQERDALYQQNRELQQRLSEAGNGQRDAADARAELAKRDAEIARLNVELNKPAPNAPAAPAGKGLDGIESSYDPASGNVTVAIPGDVLFASGQADLKPTANSKLDKIIAAVKKDYPGKQIFIDGHTDTDAINRTKDKWDDNFDLSFARAHAVMKYLTGHGLAEKSINIRAFGPNHPKATKDASRRVEIVVATR